MSKSDEEKQAEQVAKVIANRFAWAVFDIFKKNDKVWNGSHY